MTSISITVTSAGYNVGNMASFEVNHQPIAMGYGRGLNCIIIDPITAQVLTSRNFDTNASEEAANAFAHFIEDLPTGQIVALAVQDEATASLTNRARLACETIGSGLIHNLSYRASWALIGCKGAPLGTALERLDAKSKVNLAAMQTLPSAEQLRHRLRIWSAGFDQGCTFWIDINGQRLSFEGINRGLKVAVIDTLSCQVQSLHTFDTHSSSEAADQFAALVEGLPPGQFVAVAVVDEAMAHLTERAYAAFESLGSGLIRQLGYR